MYPLGWDPGAKQGWRDCMFLGWQLGGVSGRAAASGSPAWRREPVSAPSEAQAVLKRYYS